MSCPLSPTEPDSTSALPTTKGTCHYAAGWRRADGARRPVICPGQRGPDLRVGPAQRDHRHSVEERGGATGVAGADHHPTHRGRVEPGYGVRSTGTRLRKSGTV